jgi:hypothetical protein
MMETELHARLQVLAGELPGLKEAEEQAAEALAEARLVVEAISSECWAESGRGNWQAAANVYGEAEHRYNEAARALEDNLRRAGLLRQRLQQGVKA